MDFACWPTRRWKAWLIPCTRRIQPRRHGISWACRNSCTISRRWSPASWSRGWWWVRSLLFLISISILKSGSIWARRRAARQDHWFSDRLHGAHFRVVQFRAVWSRRNRWSKAGRCSTLVPTILIVLVGGVLLMSSRFSPESPRLLRTLAGCASPLSFWIMSWFLVELTVLTADWHVFPRPGMVMGIAVEKLMLSKDGEA